MKKTASLIIAIFLLLSSCGKINKLIKPPDPSEPAGAQALIEPEIKTPSESEMKSEETTEKQEAENKEEPPEQKPATNSWINKKTIAIATGTAVGAYAVYKFMDWVINADYEIPHREVDDDEYSTESLSTRVVHIRDHEGVNYEIYNENLRIRGFPEFQCKNIAVPERATRLVSRSGKIVKRNHEDQYRKNWEVRKRILYPNYIFD